MRVLRSDEVSRIVETFRTQHRTGWIAACGVQCGLLVHMSAAAIGVAAVILASATALTVLKWIGAAYLVYLGVRALLSSR